MERYFGDEENNQDFKFSDDEFEEFEEETIAYIDKQDLLDAMHMEFAQSEINNTVLSKAIEISKSDIFWIFKSQEKRRQIIENNYNWVIRLTNSEYEIEE